MSEASKQTQFQCGNQAWRARSTHGRRPIFEDADTLHSACLQYFQWCEDTPLMAVELVKYQGEAKQVWVPKMRAMTIAGLCNFLDISTSTWSSYRTNPNFLEVTERVESNIYVQKFEGAAADLLNSNIIARELGLADRQEVKRKGSGITHIESEYVGLGVAGDLLYRKLPATTEDMTLDEASRIYEDNLKAMKV